jgi:hypothetical protein
MILQKSVVNESALDLASSLGDQLFDVKLFIRQIVISIRREILFANENILHFVDFMLVHF